MTASVFVNFFQFISVCKSRTKEAPCQPGSTNIRNSASIDILQFISFQKSSVIKLYHILKLHFFQKYIGKRWIWARQSNTFNSDFPDKIVTNAKDFDMIESYRMFY